MLLPSSRFVFLAGASYSRSLQSAFLGLPDGPCAISAISWPAYADSVEWTGLYPHRPASCSSCCSSTPLRGEYSELGTMVGQPDCFPWFDKTKNELPRCAPLPSFLSRTNKAPRTHMIGNTLTMHEFLRYYSISPDRDRAANEAANVNSFRA
jgi:hypothetical protein